MKEHDLYISIGPACRPVHYLAKHGLRISTFPLDWQILPGLDVILHLFETSFSDYFLQVKENTEISGSGSNRRVVDITNQITSIHHFPNNITLEQGQKAFHTKTLSQVTNLINKTLHANSIALVGSYNESVNTLAEFLYAFSKFVPQETKLELINIRNDSSLPCDIVYHKNTHITSNLQLTEYCFNDTLDLKTNIAYTWKGNIGLWDTILCQYRLSTKFNPWLSLKEKTSVIYGAGEKCVELLHILKKYELPVHGIAVTDVASNPANIEGVSVSCIDSFSTDTVIVISIHDFDISTVIKNNLMSKGYLNVVTYREGKLRF